MSDEKHFDPKTLEATWYAFWEASGYFNPENSEGAPYCIMLPPPNVTGSLHMGHAFQQTLMDILIRYHRMKGHKTLWQAGTDHAGIATQMVVERQLAKVGQSKYDLGRDAFVDRIWQWKAESGGNITRQLRRVGASIDWSSERFTLDPGFSNAVQKVFIQLYQEGLIYRGQRLVNWDPVLKTAVSDLEVEYHEEKGSLYTLRYPFVDKTQQLDGKPYLCIATTRPETLLGDVAVAVNPKDARFTHLIGQQLQLPLTDRTIPIISDDSVEPDFGTGCVKITPAHDFNDYKTGQKHQLPSITILTKDATINENAPLKYQGLDRFDARKTILADLEKEHLLDKIEPYDLKVPKGDRSHAILEPLLTDQWFVKIEPLAKPAIKAVEEGKIRFVPENWSKTYFEWMHNIQDWCISRQLWWGHRIPAWYDENGHIYVGESEEAVRKAHQLAPDLSLKQDDDVLDTWFSSALWPFGTLGWPDQTERLKTFYPTNVLVTGFDIIFFWVARMIMFGLKFTGDIPFHEVYIHGLIQDQDGQKMSKTKGNVLDPIDLIDGIDLDSLLQKRLYGLMQPQLAKAIEEKTRAQFPDGIAAYGTDALRFTYAAIATHGRHIRFDLRKIESHRLFCNKLWNAARFVLMNTENKNTDAVSLESADLSVVDQWILSKWQIVKKSIHEYINQYRFDLAAQLIYEFVWNEYCDWYLELTKPLLNQPQYANYAEKTRQTLIQVLDELLRVMHPFMPYITEALWQKVKAVVKNDASSIMLQPYPEPVNTLIDTDSEADIEWLKSVILAIRNIRGEMNVSPSKVIPVLYNEGTEQDKARLLNHEALLKTLAKLSILRPLNASDKREGTATALVGELELLVPLDDLIDKTAEIARLTKEIDKLNKELVKIESKLNNPGFIEKAPKTVVSEEKERADALKTALEKLTNQHQMLINQSPSMILNNETLETLKKTAQQPRTSETETTPEPKKPAAGA